MPRKRSETPLRPSAGDRPERTGEAFDAPWLHTGVAVLFTTRFFLPTESADQGETLWLVLLWLACGVLWMAEAARRGASPRRLDWLDAGLALLVAGHVVSAVSVLMTEGHKRAALNMLWEWIGIGVAGLLIRGVLREQAGRERLLSSLLASGLVLSGLGFWQHYVWYPHISSQFRELEQLEQHTRTENASLNTARRLRLKELREELGFSFEGNETSLRMLRDRIQSSTEPIGRFALANTLAGLLLVAIVVGLATVKASSPGEVGHFRWVVGIILLALLGYCLLLTKSRTAMVGLMVCVSLGLFLIERSLVSSRGVRRAIFGVTVGVATMVLAAFVTGSLDREVVSETLKSLTYRLEYWTSTTRVIREHPLLGVGPGNFRQSYLRHKLPESSEEILDPHNFVLDVYVNGGLIAFAGLSCLLGVVIRRSLTILKQGPLSESMHRESFLSEVVLRGGIGSLAMVLAALLELFQGTDIRSDWIWLAAGWWFVSLLLTWTCPQLTNGKLAVLSVVGLFVHLSGAGGMAMPAVTQMVLALIFLIDALASDETHSPVDVPRPVSTGRSQALRLISIALGVLALVACAKTAALPVTKSRMSLLEGQAAANREGSATTAIRVLTRAAEQDQLSPEPWQELARVSLGQWLSSRERRAFDSAVEAQQRAIERDPKSAGAWRAMGQLWWQRFEHTGDADAAASALSGFEQAASRYPHLAALQAEVALAAQASGAPDRARLAAAQALQLDELNRGFQHADKFLSPDLLAQLRRIAESEAGPDGQ